MPLVPAKCTQCGAVLQVDNAKDAAVCPYCGTPFVVEKAVNNFITQKVTNIDNVEHADILVEDSRGRETRLNNAESFLTKHGQYERAAEIFAGVANEYSGDWRAWWGVARAMTREFTGLPVGRFGSCSSCDSSREFPYDKGSEPVAKGVKALIEENLNGVKRYADGAFNVMDEETKRKYVPVWAEYVERCRRYGESQAADAVKAFREGLGLVRDIDGLVEQRTVFEEQRDRKQKVYQRNRRRKKGFWEENWPIIVVFGALFAIGKLHWRWLWIVVIPIMIWYLIDTLRGIRASNADVEADIIQEDINELNEQIQQLRDRAGARFRWEGQGFHDFRTGLEGKAQDGTEA